MILRGISDIFHPSSPLVYTGNFSSNSSTLKRKTSNSGCFLIIWKTYKYEKHIRFLEIVDLQSLLNFQLLCVANSVKKTQLVHSWKLHFTEKTDMGIYLLWLCHWNLPSTRITHFTWKVVRILIEAENVKNLRQFCLFTVWICANA